MLLEAAIAEILTVEPQFGMDTRRPDSKMTEAVVAAAIKPASLLQEADDVFVNRLLSRDYTSGCSSNYTAGARVRVPFDWEAEPGKPKSSSASPGPPPPPPPSSAANHSTKSTFRRLSHLLSQENHNPQQYSLPPLRLPPIRHTSLHRYAGSPLHRPYSASAASTPKTPKSSLAKRIKGFLGSKPGHSSFNSHSTPATPTAESIAKKLKSTFHNMKSGRIRTKNQPPDVMNPHDLGLNSNQGSVQYSRSGNKPRHAFSSKLSCLSAHIVQPSHTHNVRSCLGSPSYMKGPFLLSSGHHEHHMTHITNCSPSPTSSPYTNHGFSPSINGSSRSASFTSQESTISPHAPIVLSANNSSHGFRSNDCLGDLIPLETASGDHHGTDNNDRKESSTAYQSGPSSCPSRDTDQRSCSQLDSSTSTPKISKVLLRLAEAELQQSMQEKRRHDEIANGRRSLPLQLHACLPIRSFMG